MCKWREGDRRHRRRDCDTRAERETKQVWQRRRRRRGGEGQRQATPPLRRPLQLPPLDCCCLLFPLLCSGGFRLRPTTTSPTWRRSEVVSRRRGRRIMYRSSLVCPHHHVWISITSTAHSGQHSLLYLFLLSRPPRLRTWATAPFAFW